MIDRTQLLWQRYEYAKAGYCMFFHALPTPVNTVIEAVCATASNEGVEFRREGDTVHFVSSNGYIQIVP